jgi:hypothetical protein
MPSAELRGSACGAARFLRRASGVRAPAQRPVSDTATTPTRVACSLWLASFFIANGLPFVRAVVAPGSRSRVAFEFDDPHGAIPELTRRFQADSALQRFIDARATVAAILDTARARGVCEPEDVASALLVARGTT